MDDIQLTITGQAKGRRLVVKINGTEIQLSNKSFRYLVRLAWARVKGKDADKSVSEGWIHRSEIDDRYVQKQNLHRLRVEVALQSPDADIPWPVFESDGYGRVRLLADRKSITFEKGVADLPDPEIQKMMAELKRRK